MPRPNCNRCDPATKCQGRNEEFMDYLINTACEHANELKVCLSLLDEKYMDRETDSSGSEDILMSRSNCLDLMFSISMAQDALLTIAQFLEAKKDRRSLAEKEKPADVVKLEDVTIGELRDLICVKVGRIYVLELYKDGSGFRRTEIAGNSGIATDPSTVGKIMEVD